MPPVVPKRIQRRDDGILIVWDGAGHEGLFPARGLRLRCPCAECVEEMSGRPLLDPARVPHDVRPVTLGQASRIEGVTSAALTLVLAYVKGAKKRRASKEPQSA